MNYKTLLMASAAVLFSTQAMAQDLTGAFSVPGKGQIMSETTLGMTRTKTKWSAQYWDDETYVDDGRYISETLEYGITDNLSINAGIINHFDVDKKYDYWWEEKYSYNNDHNFAYNLGLKYNMHFDDLLFQIAPSYSTYDPKSFYGHRGNDSRWQKNLGVDLKAGLDLGNG